MQTLLKATKTAAVATIILALSWSCCAVATVAADGVTAPPPPTQVRLVTIHRHDTDAFTEGLFFLGDALVESTGLNEKSFIRQYSLPSLHTASTTASPIADDGDGDGNGDDDNGGGKSDKSAHLSSSAVRKEFRFDLSIFGEGVTSIGDKLYALTYKAKVLLELSLSNFTLFNTYAIETFTEEGWGMTTDGELLIVSDGSSKIQFFDPYGREGKVSLVRTIDVRLDGKSVTNVNELEFVPGENEILANVWLKNHILRINATDGDVIEVIDLAWLASMVSNLHTKKMRQSPYTNDAVMNGIALHPTTKHVFVTGKLWDSMFELEFSYLSTSSRKKRQSAAAAATRSSG